VETFQVRKVAELWGYAAAQLVGFQVEIPQVREAADL